MHPSPLKLPVTASLVAARTPLRRDSMSDLPGAVASSPSPQRRQLNAFSKLEPLRDIGTLSPSSLLGDSGGGSALLLPARRLGTPSPPLMPAMGGSAQDVRSVSAVSVTRLSSGEPSPQRGPSDDLA